MRNEFVIKLECKADPNQNTVQIHVDQEEKLSGAESATPVLTMICLLVPGMSDPEKRARAVREKEKGNEVRRVRLTDVCVTGTVWPVPWTPLKAATSQKMHTILSHGKKSKWRTMKYKKCKKILIAGLNSASNSPLSVQ